jgi:TfoX/Sxy family transcriptional regulator of competence genes
MTYSPGPAPRTVRAADGQVVDVPADWELLLPGDAALTRRVKAAGDHWAVAEKKGRKVFSRGIWAPAATIQRIREELEAERAEPAYARSREADARRRAATQAAYVEEFAQAVVAFLGFHPDPLPKSWPRSCERILVPRLGCERVLG